MHDEYPRLHCYSFSPPGGLLRCEHLSKKKPYPIECRSSFLKCTGKLAPRVLISRVSVRSHFAVKSSENGEAKRGKFRKSLLEAKFRHVLQFAVVALHRRLRLLSHPRQRLGSQAGHCVNAEAQVSNVKMHQGFQQTKGIPTFCPALGVHCLATLFSRTTWSNPAGVVVVVVVIFVLVVSCPLGRSTKLCYRGAELSFVCCMLGLSLTLVPPGEGASFIGGLPSGVGGEFPNKGDRTHKAYGAATCWHFHSHGYFHLSLKRPCSFPVHEVVYTSKHFVLKYFPSVPDSGWCVLECFVWNTAESVESRG